MGLFSFLFSACSKRPASQTTELPLPELTARSGEEDFVDLEFALRSRETLPDGALALHAYGVHHGRKAGLTVVLGAHWTAGARVDNLPFLIYRGTVTYRSLGAPSDALLQILDQLYATKLAPTAMRPTTTLVALSLGGEPADLDKGPVKLKLFHEADPEDRYAEFYTNIDLANGVLQIHEKDPGYRSAIIKALRSE